MHTEREQLLVVRSKVDRERARSRSLGEETSMKANSDKSKQRDKATHRVLAGVLCGASVLSLVLSLVMPPISQAIANDAQTVSAEETVMGGGSSSESTDVDNTTNGDTENQNSDETEDDETSGDAAAAGLSSDDTGAISSEQPADDGANDENEIMATAANGFTELNQDNIYGLFGQNGTPGKYILTADLNYASTITLGQGETVIDLNGKKLSHTGVDGGNSNLPMFNVPSGATLTILDSGKAADQKWEQTVDKQGNLASVLYKGDGTPLKLTYYVTESSVNAADSTRTIETTYKHEVAINGAIVGTTAGSTMKLINVYEGGTFNLESGVLTTTQNANVGNLIYAMKDSTVNISGGYVCGASMGRNGAGAGIHVEGSTLVISDGVIAGNYAPSGGGVYALNSTIDMVGGIISGNGTNNDQSGYGAGICAENSRVTITNGYITNNKYQHYDEGHKGNGCHGGGGIAAFSHDPGQKRGSLVIDGGYITGNYSAEAGGGVYAGAWNKPLSGFTFSGGTIASNVAEKSEGGGIRISAPTVGEFNVSGKKAYITNNTTNTTNDWGGGGVFVQGSSDQGIKSASLNIYNALITNNHANGFGGGFAACPTGKTAITDTNGIAIFGNSDGNSDGSYNRSGGTHEKTDDKDEDKGGEITGDFIKAGHQDLFLIRDSANAESLPYIAAVTGQMLGGGAANWSGTIDNTPTSIGKYEGAQAKYMIGLEANPLEYDQGLAVSKATLFITHNSSNVHGGGIMTNGDVIAGSTTQVSVYPKVKLNGTKALTGLPLAAGKFKFQLLEQNESGGGPYFDQDGNLQFNECPKVGDGVLNDESGNFVFDLGRVNYTGTNVYYLVEDPYYNHVDGVDYDKTIYKIELTTRTETRPVLDINYIYTLVTNVKVTNLKNNHLETITPLNGSDVSIKITDGNTSNTFTNTYAPTGSWTPQVTKKVDGGEMKKFKFELANDENFTKPETVTIDPANATTDENGNATVAVNFATKNYKLENLENGSKTFTYYVREKNESSTYPHYKFDQSVYKLDVTMMDQKNGKITATKVTYTQFKDAEGNPIDDANPVDYNDGSDTTKLVSIPTFTNTYSTSLPLSGMSGVTLTYLAGAAVLCAAAAWMHIRRKANAKGGERRE